MTWTKLSDWTPFNKDGDWWWSTRWPLPSVAIPRFCAKKVEVSPRVQFGPPPHRLVRLVQGRSHGHLPLGGWALLALSAKLSAMTSMARGEDREANDDQIKANYDDMIVLDAYYNMFWFIIYTHLNIQISDLRWCCRFQHLIWWVYIKATDDRVGRCRKPAYGIHKSPDEPHMVASWL